MKLFGMIIMTAERYDAEQRAAEARVDKLYVQIEKGRRELAKSRDETYQALGVATELREEVTRLTAEAQELVTQTIELGAEVARLRLVEADYKRLTERKRGADGKFVKTEKGVRHDEG